VTIKRKKYGRRQNTEDNRNLSKTSLINRYWAVRHFAELSTVFNLLTTVFAQLIISNEKLLSMQSGLKQEELKNTT